MSVPVAYATMLVVWSTTPLTIVWSNETFSPSAAIALRMLFAACVGVVLVRFLRIDLPWNRKAIRAYGASLLGVYGALSATYFAADYIPSGLISVVFALSPVVSNVLTRLVLGAGEFTPTRMLAYIISLSGLAVICLDSWVVESDGWVGLLLMFVAVTLYSLSGVLVQREAYSGHPLSISVGTLLLAAPLFCLTWFFADGTVPDVQFDSKSIWAVMYLAVFGSLLGFMAYFHVLKSLGATAVAMVTLVTPVTALMLGSVLNNEAVTLQMMLGTMGILAGLLLYYQEGLMRSFMATVRS